MKKIYRYLLMTVLALCLSVPAIVAEAANVALIPLINNVKGDEIANQIFYNNAIGAINAQQGYVIVDNDHVTAIIEENKNGNNVPSEAALKKIAKNAGVDIVIAMQLDELHDDPVFPSNERIVKLTMNGKAVAPLTGGSVGVNNVHINGVEGTLSLVSSANIWESNRYFFSRTQPGQETYVQAGSIVTTSATEMYKDYIHVVCIGTYGGYATPDELVQSTKALLSRQIKNSDRYIVLGVCSDGNGFNSYGSYMNLDAIDSSMMQAFGNKYINVRKYLCEDGLSDAGLKATDADLYNISCGMVPESFRSASGGAELNGKAYNLIGKLVYDRMESLGYFDEVVSELYIKETIKQLLKEDPNYLTNVIENTLNR